MSEVNKAQLNQDELRVNTALLACKLQEEMMAHELWRGCCAMKM